MKSPAELQVVLRRQWEDSTRREARLLGAKGAWPVGISIGRPSPRVLSADLDIVKRHVARWRQISIGEVIWEPVRYRVTAESVDVPIEWRFSRPSEWVDACGDAVIRQEFEFLATLVEQIDPIFHSLLIRRRGLWRKKPVAEVVQAARLSMALEPGIAEGRPLRGVSIAGIDTKFFERNAQLITALLDRRFDGELSRIGLENFLSAQSESEHWLLVVDLDGSLLPFRKQRIRSSELRHAMVPGERLLIVENESCQHQLPAIPRTIAVLGAGFNLEWIDNTWLSSKQIAYWGDIDTWGLQFLAKARQALPHLKALLMTSAIFEQFSSFAVPEPVPAGRDLPKHLEQTERDLYLRLLSESRGRLEQEFISKELCQAAIVNWAKNQ